MDETSSVVLSGEFCYNRRYKNHRSYKPIAYTSHDDLTASPYNAN
jgi:hypothetical protein